MSVQVAGPDCRIERGARFVVREVFELALGALALAEKAGCEVAGKIGRDFDDGCLGSLANSCGASGIGLGQVGEAFLQARGVELVDGEYADAALSATGATDQKVPTAAGCIGQRRVKDLNKILVAIRASMEE